MKPQQTNETNKISKNQAEKSTTTEKNTRKTENKKR